MPITREQVDLALEALLLPLKTGGDVVTFSRVLKNWSEVPPIEQPALYINKTPESRVQDKGSPRMLTSSYDLICYTNTGNYESAIRAAQLNALLDAIDAIMKPDPVTMFQDLGGLVSHAWIEGETEIVEGTINEQALAAVPVKVLWNQDNNATKGQFWFDSGTLWARPLIDGQRVAQSDLTPIRLGNLKGIELNVEMELNHADTPHQYKVNMAIGNKTIRGSAALGMFSARAINQLYFGSQVGVGARLIQNDARSDIPGSPYQITPTVPGSGTWQSDLGVCFTDDGTPLTRVAAAPSAGEYSVSAGVYTFNASDTTKEVSISFLYDIAGGEKLALVNQFKDLAPSFEIILEGQYNGEQMVWVLNKCVTDSFSIPSSTEQFMIHDFSFEAIADLSGNVGTISQG